MRIDPEGQFEALYNETHLQMFGRTMKNAARYKPLVFEKLDRSKGIVSFKECLDKWLERKQTNPSIDLQKEFKIDFLPNKDDFKNNSKWVIGL